MCWKVGCSRTVEVCQDFSLAKHPCILLTYFLQDVLVFPQHISWPIFQILYDYVEKTYTAYMEGYDDFEDYDEHLSNHLSKDIKVKFSSWAVSFFIWPQPKSSVTFVCIFGCKVFYIFISS